MTKQSKILTAYLAEHERLLRKEYTPEELAAQAARKRLNTTVGKFLRQVGIPPLDGTEDEHFYPPRRKKR